MIFTWQETDDNNKGTINCCHLLSEFFRGILDDLPDKIFCHIFDMQKD